MACVGGGALLGTSYLYKSWNWTMNKSWNWTMVFNLVHCRGFPRLSFPRTDWSLGFMGPSPGEDKAERIDRSGFFEKTCKDSNLNLQWMGQAWGRWSYSPSLDTSLNTLAGRQSSMWQGRTSLNFLLLYTIDHNQRQGKQLGLGCLVVLSCGGHSLKGGTNPIFQNVYNLSFSTATYPTRRENTLKNHLDTERSTNLYQLLFSWQCREEMSVGGNVPYPGPRSLRRLRQNNLEPTDKNPNCTKTGKNCEIRFGG